MKQHGTHVAQVTNNTRAIRWSDGDEKKKLYLRIILLINYMMKENLFVHVECSSAKHEASQFSIRKNVTKKKEEKKQKKVTPGWTDISGPDPVSFLSRSSMYYIMLTLHNSIKLPNIVSTVFLEDKNFTSTTTWCTNDLRRLQLAQINSSKTKLIVLPSHLSRGNK